VTNPQTYYDALTAVLCDLFGHDWHLGYWLNAQTPGEAAERLNEVMAGRLPNAPDMLVLDIGCGVGGPACFIAERTGSRVIGITNSHAGMAEAERFAHERGLRERIDFRYAEAQQLPFENDAFDAVWSCEAMHNFADKAPVVRELARVLRPGGTAVLGDLFLTGGAPDERPASLDALKEFSFHLCTADDLIALLQANGIRVHESIDVGHHVGPRSPATCAEMCRAKLSEAYGNTLERTILERTVQATSLLAETFRTREVGWGIWVGRKEQHAGVPGR
jgi:SAM-dependent methyltransferase